MDNQMKMDSSLHSYIYKERLNNETKDVWFNNVSILFDPAYLFQIIPTVNMTTGEKINALTRFAFFLSLLLTIVKQNYIYIYVFIVPVIISYVVYIFAPNKKEYFSDSSRLTDNSINKMKSDDDLNKIMEAAMKQEECQAPTENNPLMNVLPTDSFQSRKPACNIINKEVSDNVSDIISEKYYDKLYNDTSNIFNDRISERPFYTMPNTQIPNDQGAFAKWLYETPVSCASSDVGILKQNRACAFNNKSLNELAKDLKNIKEE